MNKKFPLGRLLTTFALLCALALSGVHPPATEAAAPGVGAQSDYAPELGLGDQPPPSLIEHTSPATAPVSINRTNGLTFWTNFSRLMWCHFQPVAGPCRAVVQTSRPSPPPDLAARTGLALAHAADRPHPRPWRFEHGG